MAYTKRFDGRAVTALRPMEAKVGVIPRADGSAFFKIGKTEAYAAVYGPRSLYPKFLQNPQTGILRCFYNMMPFSGHGERVRPGANRRAKEISMVTENALKSVIDLSAFPNAGVDVFIEFPQTDAGSRCAGICAAAMALADAGIPMKDMVAAVAVGMAGGTKIVDLTYDEEAYKGDDGHAVDCAVAMVNNSKDVVLLQMDGEISQKDLLDILALAKDATSKINEVQKQALKDKYKIDKTAGDSDA